MVVLSLTNCPIGLRGDLSKWLFEISAGVYVGNVNKRVRDELWQRVKDICKTGSATLVFSTNNEQKFDFKVHGSAWEPIDYDGLKLILHPSPSRLKKHQLTKKTGFSNASKRRQVKRFTGNRISYPKDYLVITIELIDVYNNTKEDGFANNEVYRNNLDDKNCLIHDINILKVVNKEICDKMSIPFSDVSKTVDNIKIITDYLGDLPLVIYNENSSIFLLQTVLIKNKLPLVTNRCIDILEIAKNKLSNQSSCSLDLLASRFSITTGSPDDQYSKCILIKQLYEKLIESE